jgi:hypothetical protein
VDGQAFLQAMAHLDCPGYKRTPIHAAGGSGIENVEWRTPKTFRVVHRCYDKGVESRTAPAGRLVRLERQWWVPSSERTSPEAVAGAGLAARFAGPLRGWVQPGVGVMAVGPYDACELLRERVGHARLGGASSRLLTLRVAERIAGTIGVLGVYGDGWYENARTAQRRRAELRKVGIEFVSDLAPGVRVDVGRVEGHPLAPVGLRPFEFVQVEGSPWVSRLEEMNRVHPLASSFGGPSMDATAPLKRTTTTASSSSSSS